MNVKIAKPLVLFLLILGSTTMPLLAHEDEKLQDSTKQETSKTIDVDEVLPEGSGIPGTASSIFAPYSEFPNLHPMVVHFPIVLLLLALLAQFIGLFGFRPQLSWFTLLLLLGGFVGALLASQVFHPHTTGLPEKIKEILETHEYYANLTTWLAGAAFVFKAISHFTKRKTWAEVIIFLLITGSAVSVSLAAHLGSQMVYIEEVGPGGNYIEQHDE